MSCNSSITFVLPRTNKLINMFSCPICLEIYFEPCTTPCGHSFCKTCLQSSMYVSGRKQQCPLCRGFVSNGLSCRVNIVLWDAVQSLFPHEVKSRKAIHALNRSKNLSAAQPYQNSSTCSLDEFLGYFNNVMLGVIAVLVPCATYVALVHNPR